MTRNTSRRRIGAAVAAYWIGSLALSPATAGAFAGQTVPAAGQTGASAGQIGPAAGQTGASAGQIGPAAGQTGPAAGQTGPAAGQTVPAAGQTGPAAAEAALAGALRERFEVDAGPDGLTLSAAGADGVARSITLRGGVIEVDGVPVSGRELREMLGADADLVLRVTYLGAAERRALFGGVAAEPPAQPAGAPSDSPSASPLSSSPPPGPAQPAGAPSDSPATAGAGEAPGRPAQPAGAPSDSPATAGAGAGAAPGRPPRPAPAAAVDEAGDAPERTAETAPPRGPAAGAGAADRAPRRRTTTRGDLFRMAGPVTIAAGERVRGDATVILGPLTVDGEVTGDVTVIAGSARFGPDAVVRGDVTVAGGSLRRAPSAALQGSVTQVGLGDFNPLRGFGRFVGVGGWRSGFWHPGWRGRGWLGGEDLVGTVLRLFFLALLASGVVLVGRGPAERIARRATAEPLKAGVVGVLAQVLAVPLLVSGILVLVISVVGIPLLLLLPFVVVGFMLVMFVGFSGAVLGAGGLIRNRMGASSAAAHASVWAGVALILLPSVAGEAVGLAGGPFRTLGALLALAGFLLEYAAWTAGLGALILNRFSPAPGAPPPADPPAPVDA